MTAALVLTCGSALAAQGHAFSKTIGEPCPSGPCEGPKLKEPDGVAVNSSEGAATSGDVYVVDKAANRVVRFNSEGVFQAEFKGPSAAGSGTLTGGSSTVTEAFATEGAFTVGEEISGAGIPAGTKITAVPGGGVLELENPVEGSGSTLAVELQATQSLEHPTQVAVDSSVSEEDPSRGDVYVVDAGHAAVDKYTAEGGYLGQITGFSTERPFRAVGGVAVDQTGRVSVGAEHVNIDEGVGIFNNSQPNELVEPSFTIIGLGPQQGLAVDTSGAFYVGYSFFKAFSVDKFAGGAGGVVELVRKLPLAGVLGGFGVEPGGGDLYVSLPGVVERFGGADGKPVEQFGAGRLVGGGGVAVDRTGSVFVADGTAGVVDVFTLEEPGAPTVQSEGVSDVSAGSATFQAALNARGAQASYRFEYGRCASLAACAGSGFEEKLTAGTVPGDFAVHAVSAHVQDLLAGSAYHFRVVASNTVGGVEGEERTFTTQAAGGGLLDGRRWEMVSPPDKHGALVKSLGEFHVTQASADGRAFTFLASGATEDQPQSSANLVQVLAGRGPEGWATKDITGPHATLTGVSALGQEFRWFSEDLGVAAVQPSGGFTHALSPAASEQTAFLHQDFFNGDVSAPCVGGGGVSCYTPLVTGCPGAGAPCAAAVAEHANVPAGTVFGEEGNCPPEGQILFCGPEFVGGSPDGKSMVLSSRAVLKEGALPGSLYEWSGGQLSLVSVLPDGQAAEAAEGQPVLGWRSRSARGAISGDGSRIVWAQNDGGHLFVRDMGRGETVQLDVVQPGGQTGGGPEPWFQFASRDGSRVFFTDTQQLTADSGAGSIGGRPARDLFECEVTVVANKLSCALKDLTPAVGGVPADVRGEVLGGSEDGQVVYFVANGVLAGGAAPGGCVAVKGTGAGCSLYVSDHGVTRFVARLSAEDYPDWNDRESALPLSSMVSRVSGDGRWLVFMSQVGLSGNDMLDATRGTPVEQVYLFDLSRPVSSGGAGVAGNPVCVSCDPSGARPVGVEYHKLETEGTDGADQLWELGRLIGGSVPSWTSYSYAALQQPRFLSEDGRVFFNSPGPLVVGDVNGAADVYEFEPVGVPAGSASACKVGGPGYDAGQGGCLGLVSSGRAAGETGFLDASASGSDVFFFTNGKLSPADFDQSRDVYDAHECTTALPCIPTPAVTPPPCTTEASCKASPSQQPPIFGAPASATFNGAGNPTPPPPPKGRTAAQIRAEKLHGALKLCRRKQNKNKRALCERQARKKYGAVKAKKSTRAKKANNRRAK